MPHFPYIDPRSFSQVLSSWGWGVSRTIYLVRKDPVYHTGNASLVLPSMCLKSQVVDLRAEGYWEELMDTFRPDIVIKDW